MLQAAVGRSATTKLPSFREVRPLGSWRCSRCEPGPPTVVWTARNESSRPPWLSEASVKTSRPSRSTSSSRAAGRSPGRGVVVYQSVLVGAAEVVAQQAAAVHVQHQDLEVVDAHVDRAEARAGAVERTRGRRTGCSRGRGRLLVADVEAAVAVPSRSRPAPPAGSRAPSARSRRRAGTPPRSWRLDRRPASRRLGSVGGVGEVGDVVGARRRRGRAAAHDGGEAQNEREMTHAVLRARPPGGTRGRSRGRRPPAGGRRRRRRGPRLRRTRRRSTIANRITKSRRS